MQLNLLASMEFKCEVQTLNKLSFDLNKLSFGQNKLRDFISQWIARLHFSISQYFYYRIRVMYKINSLHKWYLLYSYLLIIYFTHIYFIHIYFIHLGPSE